MKRIFCRAQRAFALRPGMTVLLAALSVLQSALQVAMAIASCYVIDSAIGKTGDLALWCYVLGGVVLALVLIHALGGWITRSASDNCIAQMQSQLLNIAAHSPAEKLQGYHSGALLSRAMDDVRTVCDGSVRVIPSLFGQSARLVGALLAVLVICPKVAPVLLIAGGTVAILTAALRGLARKLHKKVRQTEETVTATMQEDLRQLTLIQSLQAEDRILESFDRKINRSLKAKHNRRFWLVGVNTLIASLSLVGTGALLIWGAMQVAKGQLSYGTLTAMVQLLALFRSPLLGISSLWTQLAAMDVADDRLKELLSMEANATESPAPAGNIRRIVFENVTFTYPGDLQPVLTDFSAELTMDQWVCLTGTSGIGKSTLFKLILGLYTPQKGRVSLVTDAGQFDCGSVTRGLFAYVPQDYALFSGTIAENLKLVAPEATLQQRKDALRIAQADFVWELTEGEETQVLENNAGLSMGQMQRLAIARAILMDRPVLLLDECTSALDAETEVAVLAGLQATGRQVILVTHRPEALTPDVVHFLEI